MIPTWSQIFKAVRLRAAAAIAGQSRIVRPSGKRGYSGARIDRLSADWMLSQRTGDAEIQTDIHELRNRCRDLERNDPYIKRYFGALEDNVLQVGCGYSLQMRCAYPPDFTKPDKLASQKIEMGWQKWCKPKFCTTVGEYSFFDVCCLTLRSAARDGGFLLRKIIDPDINEFGFALQPIEIDYLDHNYTTVLNNNRIVIMGVEKVLRGKFAGKVTGYYLMDRHPGDIILGGRQFGNHQRIDASEIIHYFRKERATQSIGVPWIASVVERSRHLDEYEKSEVVASRNASNKGGFWTYENGETYAGEAEETSSGEPTGATLDDSGPGSFDEAPKGASFTAYDPTHPTQQYGDFVRFALFGICAGMEMPYMELTGDLSNANYSSLRSGSLAAQQGFKKIQSHMIEHLCNEVFDAFLEASLLTQAIKLPYSKMEQFNRPKFTGRRWDWVDPEKDMRAKLLGVDAGVTTRTEITEEMGKDFEDVCQTLKEEKELAEELGLEFVTPQSPKQAPDSSSSAQSDGNSDQGDNQDDSEDNQDEPTNGRNGHKFLLTQ